MNNNKITHLGSGDTLYPDSPSKDTLDFFENPSPGRDYAIEFETSEFTSLCPVTSQPDFAKIKISYIPDKKCIESKSLKLYLFSYRNHQGFAEEIVNRILDDIVGVLSPLEAYVEGFFTPRGGISITVSAEYDKES